MNISIASLVSLYHYDSFQRCIVEKLKITSILLKLETLRVVNGPQQVTNIASSRQDAQPLQIIQFCSRKEQVSLWVQTMQDLWHLYAFVTFEVNWLISWFWRIEVVKGLDSLLSISSLCVINVSSYGRIVAIQVYPLAFHVWMKCCNACSGTLTSRSIDGWCQLGKSRYFISRLECPGPGRTWGFLVRSCMEDRSLASWYSHLDVIEFQGLTGNILRGATRIREPFCSTTSIPIFGPDFSSRKNGSKVPDYNDPFFWEQSGTWTSAKFVCVWGCLRLSPFFKKCQGSLRFSVMWKKATCHLSHWGYSQRWFPNGAFYLILWHWSSRP